MVRHTGATVPMIRAVFRTRAINMLVWAGQGGLINYYKRRCYIAESLESGL